jgi:hypothetical protein
MNLKKILSFIALALVSVMPIVAQQPQSQVDPPFQVNAILTNGVAPGYAPLPGTGLNVNIGPGTANNAGTIEFYAGGTLALTASVTNYIYLDGTTYLPSVKTSAFSASDIAIAEVLTSGSGILFTCNTNGTTSPSGTLPCIVDVRTMFFKASAGAGITLTTSGTSGPASLSGTVLNIPNYTYTLPSTVVQTNQANTYGNFLQDFSGATMKVPSGLSGCLSASTGTLSGSGFACGSTGVVSFNTRTGAVVLSAADVNSVGTISNPTTGNSQTATDLASYPSPCAGSQFSQGLSSGSNNCATPAGSGTVSPGSGYAIPAYPSGSSSTIGPSNIKTDASGNDLSVPGNVAVGASPPTLAGQFNLETQGVTPTPTASQFSCSDVTNVVECTNNGAAVFNSLIGAAADGVTLVQTGATLACASATTSNHGCVEPDGNSAHFYRGDGTFATPAGGGNYVNLCTAVTLANATCVNGQIVPSASVTNFTISVIPQTYLNLIFDCDLRSTDTTTGNFSDSATTFNSITAYSYLSSQANNASVSIAPQGFNVSAMQLWDVANANVTTAYSGGGEMTIQNYAGTTFNKHGWFTNGLVEPAASGNPAAGTTFIYRGDFWSMSTAAIASIKEALNHGNYATGSTCTLYGTN